MDKRTTVMVDTAETAVAGRWSCGFSITPRMVEWKNAVARWLPPRSVASYRRWSFVLAECVPSLQTIRHQRDGCQPIKGVIWHYYRNPRMCLSLRLDPVLGLRQCFFTHNTKDFFPRIKKDSAHTWRRANSTCKNCIILTGEGAIAPIAPSLNSSLQGLSTYSFSKSQQIEEKSKQGASRSTTFVKR